MCPIQSLKRCVASCAYLHTENRAKCGTDRDCCKSIRSRPALLQYMQNNVKVITWLSLWTSCAIPSPLQSRLQRMAGIFRY